MIIFLCFIFGLFLTDCQTETVVKEDVKVGWFNTTMADNNTDTHPSLPDKIILNISINNETVVLNLTKLQNDTFEDVPVILGDNNENNHLWNHSQYEQFSVYNDKLKDASFSVVINKEHGKPITEYYGSFAHKDIKYSLVPKQYHEKSNKTTDVVHTFNLNGTDYVVYKDTTERTNSNETEKDAITPEADNNYNYTTNEKIGNTNETSRSERRKRSVNMNLVVDLLVVVDYSMYKRWFLLTSKRKDDTIERIRYYLAHVINGVNNVYSTMQGHKLSVKVVAIYIAQKKQQSNFTEDPKVHINKDNNKRINYTAALDNFRQWVVDKQKIGKLKKKNVLPPGNVAIAFTDYDQTPTEGLAYLSTVCTEHAVAIAREKGQFDTISIVAHEIGHVLGADHDDDRQRCLESDHYLMSPTVSSSHLQNRDKLSSCSIEYITNKVYELISQGRNCLDSSKKQTKEEDLRKHLDTIPGLHFGLDEQCKLKFGNSYKYCSEGRYTHLKICDNMKCSKGKTCEIGHPIALNGTFCGNNKWCINGKCVSGNPNFTTDKDTCIFGDKSDSFIFNNVTSTCKIVKKNPSYCYTKLGEWCCESCDKIKKRKKSKIIGCEYGDKGMSIQVNSTVYECEGAIQHPYFCQIMGVIENCCETCQKVKKGSKPPTVKPPTVKPPTVNTYRIPTRNPQECIDETNLYLNNQPFHCNSLFNDPVKCYVHNTYCCATCTQIKQQKGNKQNCLYGDRDITVTMNSVNYNCAQAVQSNEHVCKTPEVATLCCESCNTSRQGQISLF